jgi:GT2 family glycosyltransferase
VATAVLQLDLTDLPPEVHVDERYSLAMILVRYRKRPIGKVYASVRQGRVGDGDLRKELTRAVAPLLQERWLHDYLGWEEISSPARLPQATVAVCTRDRPDDLRRGLEAFMRMPDDGQEYLIVDNCPKTDATRQIVSEYAPRVRYVREDRPGLDVARNRVLREARHEIVAFNDDDAVPEPEWLRYLLRNFADATVMCATGLTLPLELETEAQEWFEYYSSFSKGFYRRTFDGTIQDPTHVGQIGAGANMAVRRKILEEVGAFDEALDAGTLTKSGGDHEMFYRILNRGFRIVYDPEAVSWHRHRRSMEELRDTFRGYGVGVYSFWTREFIEEKEWRVATRSAHWFWGYQLPGLFRSALRRPGTIPLRLALDELRGCALGPSAYFRSRKRLRKSLQRQTAGGQIHAS